MKDPIALALSIWILISTLQSGGSFFKSQKELFLEIQKTLRESVNLLFQMCFF